MDVSHFIFMIGFFCFIPGEGGTRAVISGNVRVEFATKTLLPWRTDICCLSKRHVYE